MLRLNSKLVAFSTSLALIASQISLGSTAFTDTSNLTPEATLISSTIALQGERLAPQEMQRQLETVIDHYDTTAPLDGRDVRTEEALVSLGVYTPAQAAAFENRVQAVSLSLASAQISSPEQARQAVQTQLMSLVHSSSGAEFSSCDIGYGVSIALVAGGGLLWYLQSEYGTTTTYDTTSTNNWYGYGGLIALLAAGIVASETAGADGSGCQ